MSKFKNDCIIYKTLIINIFSKNTEGAIF
jgi:hypothetical protein